MKNLYSILVAFLLCTIFFGCKKEKITATNSGELTFQGVKYATNNGYLLKGPKENTGYGLYVMLTTDPIIYDVPTQSFSGTTNMANIYLVSSSQTEITPGTYKFIDRPLEKFYIWDAWYLEVYLNYNFDKEEGELYENDLDGGEVTVSKTGNDYDITYITTYKGKPLKGFYKGQLKTL